MLQTVQQTPPSAYRTLVQRLALVSPTYAALHTFLQGTSHATQSPARITVAVIPAPYPSSSAPTIHFKDIIGTAKLADELESSKKSEDTCRLFIVENVCAQTIELLGERFDIDPQFFADHLRNEPWYRIENGAERIPALPSSQKLRDYLQLRYIEARTVSTSWDKGIGGGSVEEDSDFEKDAKSERVNTFDLEAAAPDSATEVGWSFMLPDDVTARIPRKADKLIPRARKGKMFEPLLCTSQAVTVWFQNADAETEGWNGVVLMDPPFQLSKSDEFCLPSAYRNFDHRSSLLHGPDDLTLPKSNREALTCRLKQRFMKDADLFKSARKDSFLILGDLYRLIASNWVVVNEYVNRELATIEYILEKEEPGFRDLEIFLKHLHICRRRCVKYHELITEAKEQCHKRGQQSWSTDTTSRLSAEFANDTEGDFTYLQEKTQGTAQRIEKNINLLASLVAISAGKQGMEDGRGISRFKLLAFVLLPFSIIAAILGMQGELSIGGKDFWLFWAVVLSPIGSVFAVLTLDDGIGSRLFPALTKRLGFAKRKKFAVDEM